MKIDYISRFFIRHTTISLLKENVKIKANQNKKKKGVCDLSVSFFFSFQEETISCS